MKYTKFSDIPQFTTWGGYATDVSWSGLEHSIETLAAGTTLELDPDFQREHVWTEEQQIAFVEFKLRGGKSGGDILWNCSGWPLAKEGASLVLVDGKQRLQAVRKFLNNDLKVFGSFYSEYSDKIRYMTTMFRFHVNNLETRKEVLQWYIDINAGGTPHTKEEIEKVHNLLDKEI